MSLQYIPGQTIAEPVTLAQLNLRLKLTSTADDTQLTGIITQAREVAERVSRRSLAYKSYAYTLITSRGPTRLSACRLHRS